MKKLFGNRDNDLDFKDIDIVDLEDGEPGYGDQADDQSEIYYAEGYDEADASYEDGQIDDQFEEQGALEEYEDEQYADEQYEDGQYADDQQYEEGQYEEGQYADEQYADDGQYEEGQLTDEQYVDDGQYEEDQFTDGQYADEQYEEEQLSDERYADEQQYEEEQYAEEQPEKPLYEEEDISYDEELEALLLKDNSEWGLSSKRNQKSLVEKLGELETIDKVIMCTSILVLALAIVFGYYFLTGRKTQTTENELATVGNQVQNIDVIGGIGLTAVANEENAKMMAAKTDEIIPDDTQPADEITTEYDELEYDKNVSISLGMTSVKEDLKIKFVNKKTGKLVANVPFSVTITKPDKSTEVWLDDDMDGIIHHKEIAGGAYKVAVNNFTDERYADYTLPIGNQMVDVKSEIAYKKVDVSDEVKKESEINASVEDTVKNETVVESVLEDTVPWVESTAIVDTYTEILKSEVLDPMKVVKGSQTFKNIGYSGCISPDNKTIAAGEAFDAVAQCYDDAGNSLPLSDVVWYTSDGGIVSVAGGDVVGHITGVSPGSAMVSFEGSISDVNTGEVLRVAGAMSVTVTGGGASPADVKGSAHLEKDTLVVAPGASASTKVTTSGFTPGRELEFAVSGGNWGIASISVDGAGNINVNGIAAGETAFDLSVNYKGGSVDTAVGMRLTVKVGADRSLKLDATERTINTGESTAVIACMVDAAGNVIPSDGSQGVFNISFADPSIAGASATGLTLTFVGYKEGGTNATVTYTENGITMTASIYIVVQGSARNDTTTKLLDNKNNQVYVFENGKYREAVYADYYTADKFFIRGEARYTGWQTIDGKVFYFLADGTYVTGEQVIMGAKYNFASDGTLVTGSGTMGIDVSKHNGTIDWNAVRNSGVSYVIIRCGYRGKTQGMLIEDPKFAENIKGATLAGLKVGVYFFSQAIDEVEAVYEASYVIEKIKNYRISYPVFLDVEASGGRGDKIDKNKRTAVCKAFCETIKNAGYNAGIYANKTWLEQKLDPNALGGFKIWLAQYAAAPTYGGRYEMWQYKCTGKVSGITTDVDMNLSYLGY